MEKPKKLKAILKPAVLIVVLSIVLEVFIFNFRTFQSLPYKEVDVTETASVIDGGHVSDLGLYYLEDESIQIQFDGDRTQVKNVLVDGDIYNRVDFPFVRTGVYDVTAYIDDGELYNGVEGLRPVGKQAMLAEIPLSQIMWIQSKGDVSTVGISVTMDSGYIFQLNRLVLNAHVPFSFSFPRFLIILGILVCIYAFRKDSVLWKEDCVTTKSWKQFIVLGMFVLTSVLWLVWMQENAQNIGMADEYKPYQELAEALRNGNFYLSETPSEELLSMDDPYGFWGRASEQILFDHVYYDGHYYVYLGILPCLMFFYPFYALTGLHLSNSLVVWFLMVATSVGMYFLLKTIIQRYFVKTPFASLLLMVGASMGALHFWYDAGYADAYMIPILSSMALTLWGLTLWIRSCKEDHISIPPFLIGSVCMAAVAACRPTLAVFSFLAWPIFGTYLKRDKTVYPMSGRVRDIALLFLPYVFVAGCLMTYNKMRFGSPFDFGFDYNLTIQSTGDTKFSIYLLWDGLYQYFLKFPGIEKAFPFLQGAYLNVTSQRYYILEEGCYGGLLWTAPVLFLFFGLKDSVKQLKDKKIFLSVLMLPVISAFLMVLDVEYTYCIAMRYQDEFCLPLLMICWILYMAWQERSVEEKDRERVRRVFTILAVWTIVFGFFYLVPEDARYSLVKGNTLLFYKIFYAINIL